MESIAEQIPELSLQVLPGCARTPLLPVVHKTCILALRSISMAYGETSNSPASDQVQYSKRFRTVSPGFADGVAHCAPCPLRAILPALRGRTAGSRFPLVGLLRRSQPNLVTRQDCSLRASDQASLYRGRGNGPGD